MAKDLINDIHTLLDNSLIEPSNSYLIQSDKQVGTELVVEDLAGISFINKQVIALKSYYTQLGKAEQKIFINCLLLEINFIGPTKLGSIATKTLVHIGEFSKIQPLLESCILSLSNQTELCSVLTTLSGILKYEWNVFKPEELGWFTDWINQCYNGKNQIGKRIFNSSYYNATTTIVKQIFSQLNILNTRRITSEIYASFNPEINEDRGKLIDQFNKYDFPTDLADTLEKIDQKMFSATDAFDYKGCMDLMRSFTERLYESIAVSLDSVEGKKVNSADSNEVARFYVKQGLISEGQSDILKSLRHFLSNSGSHKLKSKPEDARLSRNMMIEFSLYLLRRLKDLRGIKK